MKIKKLFAKIENTNEIVSMNDEKYALQFITNNCIFPAEFFKYSDFAEYVKEEFNKKWKTALLKNFELRPTDTVAHEYEALLYVNYIIGDGLKLFHIRFKVVKVL